MPARTVGGIAVDLIARTAKWTEGFRRAQAEQNRFAAGLKSAAAQIASYAAGYLAVRQLVTAFNEQRRAIDEVAKASDRLGISTKAYAAFSLAARKAGASTEQMGQALTYMTRNIGEAVTGNAEMSRTFARLGINVETLAKMRPDEQYKRIAQAISRVDDVARQTSFTMDIFGRSGAQMLNLIKGGAAAIDDAAMKTKAFGTAIDREAAAKVEAMNDAITDLGEAFDGIKTQLLLGIAPALTKALEITTEWLARTRSIGALLQSTEMGKDIMRGGSRVVAQFEQSEAAASAAGSAASSTMDFGESSARARALQDRYAALDTAEKNAQELELQLRTQEEILQESYERRLAIIDEAERQGVETSMTYSEMRARLEEQKEKRITEITRQETLRRRQMYIDNAQVIINGLQDIAASASMSAREQFEITKALKIAEAIVNTAAAVMRYYSEGQTGMAVTVGIIGAAQVAAIAATTFEGGGSTASTSVPALSEGSTLGEEQGPRTPQTVNLMFPEGTGLLSLNQIRALVEQLNEANSNGYILNVG